MLPDKMPPTAIPCTLVVPPQRRKVMVNVATSLGTVDRMPPLLFLKRVDDGSGTLCRPSTPLREGQVTIEFHVPSGAYELNGLPVGEIDVVHGPRTLVVGQEDVTISVSVARNSLLSEVELQGVGPQDLPVTVYPRPAGQLVSPERPELLFCGPHRWRSTTDNVRLPPGPIRLVVIGRGRSWIAKEPLTRGTAKRTVPLEPGGQLEIRWRTKRLHEREGMVVDVKTTLGSELASFEPQCALGSAMLVARLVVPLGKVGLVCRNGDGTTEWARDVEVMRAYQRVDVE